MNSKTAGWTLTVLLIAGALVWGYRITHAVQARLDWQKTAQKTGDVQRDIDRAIFAEERGPDGRAR
ncbi:MAG TPA: hypothetical protein VGA73_14530 [Candidatus Binatia bacterium]